MRSFECLGACDIAPMASVNGEYIGPLELEDAARIVEDLNAGRPVLRAKQLRYRALASTPAPTRPARHRRAARSSPSRTIRAAPTPPG